MNQEHVAIIHIAQSKIITGHSKIINKINTTQIEWAVNDIKTKILTRDNDAPEMTAILKWKIDELQTNLKQIQPKSRRQKRWDALGRAWKWMSGSPDADDLNLINTEIYKVTKNNNLQISINDNLYEGFNNMTEAINELVKEEHKIYDIVTEGNNLFSIILNLDIINQEIIQIQNAIILSKLGIVNNRILRPKEIEFMNQILSDQGIPIDLLDEALGFASVTIGTDGETILYIINVPNLSNSTYQHLRVEPIIEQSLRIKLEGNDYLYGNNKLYLKTDICSKLGNWSLCNLNSLKDVSTDECISNIILGQNSRCTYESIGHHPIVTEMSPTILLLNEANDTLLNTCGISDRKLVGSFLITYQNCTISIRNITFTNQIIYTAEHPIFALTTGLKVTRRNIEQSTDIHTLRRLHHKNLEHLENLKVTTVTHQWTIVGGFSFTTFMIITVAIYTIFRLRNHSKKVHINQPKPHKSEDSQPADPAPIHFYQPPSLRM